MVEMILICSMVGSDADEYEGYNVYGWYGTDAVINSRTKFRPHFHICLVPVEHSTRIMNVNIQ